MHPLGVSPDDTYGKVGGMKMKKFRIDFDPGNGDLKYVLSKYEEKTKSYFIMCYSKTLEEAEALIDKTKQFPRYYD